MRELRYPEYGREWRIEMMNAEGEIAVLRFGDWEDADEVNAYALLMQKALTGDHSWRTLTVTDETLYEETGP